MTALDPVVTITLESVPDSPTGTRHTVQTQFAYSQRHTPGALAAIETLHQRLLAAAPKQPKHIACIDGSIRVRRSW